MRVPPNKAALYRQQAERLRAIAQQSALAQTKLLLLKAVLHLEEKAADEDRKPQGWLRPPLPAREE